jgi:adenylyltransferase/sulfurtransferase
VIGALAGVIGTIQATEVLKLILGKGRLLTNRLLDYDARETRFREIRVTKNPRCPLCGERPEITRLVEHEPEVCAVRTA